MLQKFRVEKISSKDTIDLRSRILRPGQPIEICHYPKDQAPTTFHLGIYFESKIICNGTFMQEIHKDFLTAKLPYRLRGMATDFSFQKKGLGSLLLRTAVEELKLRNSDFLWFNARTSVELFYKKLGFLSVSEVFEISGVGPHKVMYKWLK